MEPPIAAAAATPRTGYALAVNERETAEPIGFGRPAIDPHQRRGATTGFALRPASRGAGYGLETVKPLLGVAFGGLGLRRVRGARSPLNMRLIPGGGHRVSRDE
ncbi:GNAT family N-acetyltransferase [Streptomyces sp. NPDC000348]|uniref:GNAT family N-acetyltransferase n=1 Tax=Streptomyces sp. NPDC000348 TaxID=3364538 RepID=UPI0036C25B8D